MHPTARPVIATALAAALLVPLAGAASAHVTVQGPDATQGGYAKLAFRVPTEKDVPTTKLEVSLPEDTPIASVRVKPHPGWTAALTTAAPAKPFERHGRPVTEVVTRITWTVAAGGAGIRPSEFDEFEISAGPLPETDELVFKAVQTYADGQVVRWIEQAEPGGAEPEHPAPVLSLAAPEQEPAASAPEVDVEPVALSQDTGGQDGLAIAALVVAALAVVTAVAALLRGRRTA